VLDAAADALLRGEVVGIPTDTVYGVCAACAVPGATARLFEVKHRPIEVAVPVLVADVAQAREIAVVPPMAAELMRAHWPGGLTIVLPRAPGFIVDLGGEDATTVGVRVADHHVPIALARRVGPLATTSANRHGEATPTTAAGVRDVLGLAIVIDGGVCEGAPSTVVAVRGGSVVVLRSGAIAID
jgi:tRNA threonylcarbamoyl adenosine modification protein (Sua5/YciO/YrdC/YwlC family)